MYRYGLEGVWLFLVVLNAITEFREMGTAARENGGDCTEYWTEDGWNYVDWVQVSGPTPGTVLRRLAACLLPPVCFFALRVVRFVLVRLLRCVVFPGC